MSKRKFKKYPFVDYVPQAGRQPFYESVRSLLEQGQSWVEIHKQTVSWCSQGNRPTPEQLEKFIAESAKTAYAPQPFVSHGLAAARGEGSVSR